MRHGRGSAELAARAGVGQEEKGRKKRGVDGALGGLEQPRKKEKDMF